MERQDVNVAFACRFRLLIVVLCACLSAALAPSARASAQAVPMRISVGPAVTAGTWTVYPLELKTPGSAVLALLPSDLPVAELVINGAVVRRAGKDVNVGSPGFGHGGSTLLIEAIRPQDRVAIRMSAPLGPPQISAAIEPMTTSFDSGLWSGIFLGSLAAIVLFQAIAALGAKERMLHWFVAWILSLMAIELERDGIFLFSSTAAEGVYLLLNLVAIVSSISFVVSYLELRQRAPRLFIALVLVNAAAAIAPGMFGVVMRRPPDQVIFSMSIAIAVAFTIAITLIRRRTGFKPASYLAFGMIGILAVFGSRVVRELTGMESTALDRWSYEVGSLFDIIVFTLGLSYRRRYRADERAALEAELQKAQIAAAHDVLTGLLNRRGLENYISERQALFGTLLCMDLDGFKAVNDQGGHAAGDDTLTIVARVIEHSVRAGDAVARVGGDEFVVFLADCQDQAEVQDCISRISSAVGFLRPLGPHSETRIGVSIGSAPVVDRLTFAAALQAADADAYRVKADHHSRSREFRRSARQ